MKKNLILLAVIVLTSLSTTVYAQEPIQTDDPAAIFRAQYDAVNAGDLEGSLAYISEDTVGIALPPPADIAPYTIGIDGYRGFNTYLIGNNAEFVFTDIQVTGNTVTFRAELTEDFFRAMGVFPIRFSGSAVIDKGMVASETFIMDPQDDVQLTAAVNRENNRAILLRSYEEVFNKGNMEVLEQDISPDAVDHSFPDLRGVDAFKIPLMGMREAMPDLQATADVVVAEGDLVIALTTFTGTHEGEFLGAPPTGEQVTWSHVDINRIENGQVVEAWHIGTEAMLQALGVSAEGMAVADASVVESDEEALQAVSDAEATSETDALPIPEIEALVEDVMQELGVPGTAIGIVKDNEFVYSKGFGVTEIGAANTVTPQSVFMLSSNAKTVTSVALMQLVEDGKIDLDAPVTDYLPYFEMADERYSNITIRHLLSHTSGMPEYDYLTIAQDPQFDDEALERYVRSLSTEVLLSAPGEQFSYSGIGYDVLGDVIAKISGQSFESYVSENVFQPLGMSTSTMLLNDVDPQRLASPHTLDESGEVVIAEAFPYDRIRAPDTTLYSTVEDMAKFAIVSLNQGAFNDVTILKPDSYEQMWTLINETVFPPPDNNYGMGWMISEWNGHRVVGHAGLDTGFNAALTLLPDDSTALIVMTNHSYFASENPGEWQLPGFILRDSILDLLLNVEE